MYMYILKAITELYILQFPMISHFIKNSVSLKSDNTSKDAIF